VIAGGGVDRMASALGLEGIEAIVFRTIGDQVSLWESSLPEEVLRLPAGPVDRAAVTVHGDSLAAVLAVAEKCVASHRGRQSAEVLAALAELRAALPEAAARSETANETKLRQGGRRKDEQDRPTSRRRSSSERRMRDSNSRGVAPNTLSKRAP
jgi:hypothetical protein